MSRITPPGIDDLLERDFGKGGGTAPPSIDDLIAEDFGGDTTPPNAGKSGGSVAAPKARAWTPTENAAAVAALMPDKLAQAADQGVGMAIGTAANLIRPAFSTKPDNAIDPTALARKRAMVGPPSQQELERKYALPGGFASGGALDDTGANDPHDDPRSPIERAMFHSSVVDAAEQLSPEYVANFRAGAAKRGMDLTGFDDDKVRRFIAAQHLFPNGIAGNDATGVQDAQGAGAQVAGFIKGLPEGAVAQYGAGLAGSASDLLEIAGDDPNKGLASEFRQTQRRIQAQIQPKNAGQKAGQVIGQVVPQAFAGFGGVPGAADAVFMAMGPQSFSSGIDEYRAAMQQAGQEFDAQTAALVGVANLAIDNITEKMGYDEIMEKMPRLRPAIEGLKNSPSIKTAAAVLDAALFPMIVEGPLEEGTGQLAQNVVAKGVYDPKRSLTEGVAEASAWGSLGGLAFSLPNVLHAVATGKQRLSPTMQAVEDYARARADALSAYNVPVQGVPTSGAADAPINNADSGLRAGRMGPAAPSEGEMGWEEWAKSDPSTFQPRSRDDIAAEALRNLTGEAQPDTQTVKTPQDRVDAANEQTDAMRLQALAGRVQELQTQLAALDPATEFERIAPIQAELDAAIGQHAQESARQSARSIESVPADERAALLQSLLGGAPTVQEQASTQAPSTAEPPDLGGLMAPKTWEEAAPIFERMQGVPSDREYYQNLDQSRRDAADNAAFMDEAKGLEGPGTVSGGHAEDVPSNFRMYESMGADELRRLLAERRMYTTGGKQALVQRLREADRAGVKTGTVAPDAPLDERGLQSRSPDVYEGQWPKYTQMPVEHLREIAANRDLDPKGGKAALVKRLEEDDAKVEEAPQQPGAVSAETSKEQTDEKQEEGQGRQGLLSDKSPVEPPAPAAGETDEEPSEFTRRRDAAIKASKEAGNRHLDQEPRYVENSRGREIYNVHDPKERGVIRTVANTGEVVVHWSDKYSADANLATKKTEKRGRKSVEVYESWLMPSDLKDYVFKPAPTGTTPSESQSPPSRAGSKAASDQSRPATNTPAPASSGRGPAASGGQETPSAPPSEATSGQATQSPDANAPRQSGGGAVQETRKPGASSGSESPESQGRGRQGEGSSGEGTRKPAAATPKYGTQIGVNSDGNPVYEDARGVRSYADGNVVITEPVRVGPRGEFGGTGGRRDNAFKTAEEVAKDQEDAPETETVVRDDAAIRQELLSGLSSLAATMKPGRAGVLRQWINGIEAAGEEGTPGLVAQLKDFAADAGSAALIGKDAAASVTEAIGKYERQMSQPKVMTRPKAPPSKPADKSPKSKPAPKGGGVTSIRSPGVVVDSLDIGDKVEWDSSDGTTKTGYITRKSYENGGTVVINAKKGEGGGTVVRISMDGSNVRKIKQDSVPSLTAKDFPHSNPRVSEMAAGFASGDLSIANILEARKWFEKDLGKVEAGTDAVKQVDEWVEQAVVMAARRIVSDMRNENKTPREIMARLVGLYQQQPNLASRTSTSISQQAYSTPVPLAWLVSQLAGVGPGVTVYEPTAGNGMLLIDADPSKAYANELNPRRADGIRETGVSDHVTVEDGTIRYTPAAVDVVVGNPPFGVVRNAGGQKLKWRPADGKFTTDQIDHAVVFKALESLHTGGTAAFIVGGVKTDLSDDERARVYSGEDKNKFYKFLYDGYDVLHHFTVDGDLYSRQGAKFPVDVLVVSKTGGGARKYPWRQAPRVYHSWDDLSKFLADSPLEGRGPETDLGSEGSDRSGDSGSGPGADDGQGPDAGGLPGGPGGSGGSDVRTPRPRKPRSRPSGKSGSGQGSTSSEPNTRPDGGDAGAAPNGGDVSTRGRPQQNQGGNEPGTGQKSGTDKPGPVGPSADAGPKPGLSSAEQAELDDLIRKLNAKTRNETRSGFDPAMFAMAARISYLVVKKGARKFVEFAKAMVEALGDGIKQQLKGLYKAVLEMDEADTRGMDDADAVDATDLESIWEPAKQKTKPPRAGGPKETEHQAQYHPASKGQSLGTLMPRNQQAPVQASLDDLVNRVGDLGEFVASKLQMKPADVMNPQVFSAEQVDAIAMAIDQVDNGGALVLGDQTGIGKGRVVAAMMLYASRNDMIPVFVTEKANLYGDIVRDLIDIGQSQWNLLPTNASLSGADAVTLPDGRVLKGTRNAPSAMLGALRSFETGKGLVHEGETYHAVVTTYSQLQGPTSNDRRTALLAMAPRAMVILDESHNAGGTGKPMFIIRALAGKAPPRSEYFRELVERARGVMYSSATWAKRPTVMDLYRRTDMRLAVERLEDLADTIRRGGVAMQQVVSAALSGIGQYVRRERSYEGVDVNDTVVAADLEHANAVSAAFKAIHLFDKAKQDAVANVTEQLADDAATVIDNTATGKSGVTSTNFTSIMHNIVTQYMLAAKVPETVKEIVASLERGEKVVIGLANTMQGIIEETMLADGASDGDVAELTFNNLVMRYARKSRTLTTKNPDGTPEHHYLTDEELGAEGLAAWNHAIAQIAAIPQANIPMSPIDYLRDELEKQVYIHPETKERRQIKVGEITGRSVGISYKGRHPVYSKRSSDEMGVRGRQKTISGFQNGTIDAIILNSSGATGISLHADAKRAKDLRRRRMFILQSDPNIDVVMQLLGRVHRTGQASAPAYTTLFSSLPSEKRPGAVLAKKLASLNANVTSSRGGSMGFKLVDVMNEVGDWATLQVLRSNPEWLEAVDMDQEHLDTVEEMLEDPPDNYEPGRFTQKATGFMVMAPVEEQERFWSAIETTAAARLDELNRIGANPLEASAKDLRAETLSKEQDTPPRQGRRSWFTAPSYIERVRIRSNERAMSAAEIVEELRTRNGLADASDDELPSALASKHSAWMESIRRRAAQYAEEKIASAKTPETAQKYREQYQQAYAEFQAIARAMQPGRMAPLTGDTPAVVLEIVKGADVANPAAKSGWKAIVAQADIFAPRVEISFTSDAIDLSKSVGTYQDVSEEFDSANANPTEERYIVTGNLLASNDKGVAAGTEWQAMFFTRKDGSTDSGLLMPRDFDIGRARTGKPRFVTNGDRAIEFLRKADSSMIGDAAGVLNIEYSGGEFLFSAPKSRQSGGPFYLHHGALEAAKPQEFVSAGGRMRMDISVAAKASKIIQAYIDSGVRLKVIPHAGQDISNADIDLIDRIEGSAASDGGETDTNPRLSPSSIRQLARDQGIEGADTAAPVILRRRLADNQIAQQDAANVQESLRATHGKSVTVEPVQPAPGLETQLHSFLTRMGQTPVFLQIEGDDGAVQGLALGRDGSRVYIRAGLAESIAPGVALHELMHSLRSQNKELWSAVVDALGPDALKDSIATYRSELVSNFGENSGVVARFDRSTTLQEDEGLARAIERMATDPEIRAAMTAKPGLWARLKRWLKAQLERLGLGNEGAVLRKAVLDALDEMERGGGPGGGEQSARFSVAPPTDSPAFRAWFGDSKAVGKSGKPLRMLHGTGTAFTVFRGDAFAAWTTRNVNLASAYSSKTPKDETSEATALGAMMPVYIRAENPAYLDVDLNDEINGMQEGSKRRKSRGDFLSGSAGSISEEMAADALGMDIETYKDIESAALNENKGWFGYPQIWRVVNSKAFRVWIESQGYDSIVAREGKAEVWAVMNPTQIKSATGNQGTYDPANPDIRFSVAPGQQPHPAPASIGDITNAAIYVAGTALNQKVRDGRPLSALTKTLIDKVGKAEIKTDAARKNIRTLAKAIIEDSGPDGEGFARAVAAVKERRAKQDEKARDAKVAKRFKAKDAESLSGKLTDAQKRAAQMSKIEQKGADAATKAADKEMSKAARAVVGVYNRTMREGRQRMAELIPEFIHQISTARKAERAMANFEHRSEVEGEGLPKGVYGLNATPVDPSKPPSAAAKQRIADGIRSQVVRLLDNLPRQLRHKYLAAVKNTTTPAMLVGILNRMRRDLVRWDAKVRAVEAYKALSAPKGVKVLEPEVEKEVVAARDQMVKDLQEMRARKDENGKKIKVRKSVEELMTLRDSVRDAANLIVSAFHDQAKQDEIRIGAETLDAAKARGQIIQTVRAMPQLDGEGTTGNPETNIIKRTIRRRSGWESLSLLIDGGKQGGPAMALFRDVLKGRRNAIEMHHRFADGFGAIVTANGYSDLGKFLAEVSGVLGPAAHKSVKVKFGPHESLTLGQALYIYASMKDEGFLARVLPKYDDDGNVTRAGQPLQFKDANLDQPFTITAADLTRVAKAIPQNLRRIVDQGKQLYDETYFEKLSRTNKRLKGYFLEKVPGYWGIKIARKSGPDRGTPSNWKGAAIRALEAAGFMQERTGASKAPVAIGDFGVDILLRSRAASHTIHKSERVKALVRTLLHADPANPDQNVVTAIAKSLGADTIRRLETRIAMWSEGDMGMSADKTWRQIMGLWARAKTQLWIPTWLRNASGAAKLLNDLAPSDFAGGLSGLTWATFKELRKYSPELRERWDGGGMGAFHTDEGAHVGHAGITDAAKMTFKQLAMAAGTAAQRGNAARGELLKGSWRAWKSTVDAITVGNFFDAIPAMVAYRAFLKKAPKTLDAEGKKRWAARHATRVFERTANTSNTEYSNDVQLAARDSVMLASFIPFTGDLAKTQNMVYEAWMKGPKKFIRAATVIAFASTLSSIVTALVRGAGGDDKDKAAESAKQRFYDEILSIIPGGSAGRQVWKSLGSKSQHASVLDTPIGDLLDQVAKLSNDVGAAWDRGDRPLRARMLTAAEIRNRAIMRAVDLGGDLSGIPIGQYRRFITQAIEKWSK